MHTSPKSIYAERATLVAGPQVSRGTEAVLDPAIDAFLIGEVDLSLDPQILERKVYRPSFSPAPGEVGRKPFKLTFTHEVKGSGDRTRRSKLGNLLRQCKMQEQYIDAGAAAQIADSVVFGDVYGSDVVFAKTTAPTAMFGSYLVRCVKGGGTGVAELQVFRWNQADHDGSVLWSTRHDAVNDYFGATTLSLDLTDETQPVFTVGGVATAGDSVYAVLGGLVFKHTVDATDIAAGAAAAQLASIATRLAAKISEESTLSAVAAADEITVTFLGNAAPVAVTSGSTVLDLGDSGAQVTPTFAGALVVGQMWIIRLYEVGYIYMPITDDELAEVFTAHLYIDGELYRMLDVQGTVTFEGTAGDYASAKFELTGQYTRPVVQPMPTATLRYELTKPPKVEVAQLSIHGMNDFCAESFTIELGNDVTDQLCMNREDGYAGANISGRTPTLTANPEGSLDVFTAMWGDFDSGEEVPVHLRVGTKSGNSVRFFADRATYTGIALSDRDKKQVKEPTFQLNGLTDYGDDELCIAFP